MTIELRDVQRNLPDMVGRREIYQQASGLRRHYPADHEDERFRRINALLTTLVADMGEGSIGEETAEEAEAVIAEILTDPKVTAAKIITRAVGYETIDVAIAEFDMPDGSPATVRVSEDLYRMDDDRDWLGELAQAIYDRAEAESA